MKGVKTFLELVEELVLLIFGYARPGVLNINHHTTALFVHPSRDSDEAFCGEFY